MIAAWLAMPIRPISPMSPSSGHDGVCQTAIAGPAVTTVATTPK